MADLTKGVIVILSGGGFDEMNPQEVRDRMDECITHVNNDPFVQANSGGAGLTFQLLAGQTTKHLHQTKWRALCDAIKLLDATPLIIVGHSNGGAAAVSLSRCLNAVNKTVDLLFTADSVGTLDDLGDQDEIPPNVRLNINPYTKVTPAWFLAPFPIGKKNRSETDHSFNGILNAGLAWNLPGVLGHRNAFYDLAGGQDEPDHVQASAHPPGVDPRLLEGQRQRRDHHCRDRVVADTRDPNPHQDRDHDRRLTRHAPALTMRH